MTRTMTDEKILSVVDEMVGILSQPYPDPLLWQIVKRLAPTSHDIAELIIAVAAAAGSMSLQAIGIDPAAASAAGNQERVRLMYQVPADDIPDWEKAAGALITEATNFILTSGADADAHADALMNRAAAITNHGTEFALRTLGAELGSIRQLVMGDTWGVIRR